MVGADVSSTELPRVVVDDIERVGVATAAALPSHARRRGVVLALHGRGPVSPWCPDRVDVDAIVDGLVAAGMPTRWTALGRARASEGGLRKLSSCAADPRTIGIDFPSAPGRLVLPRPWLGRHLVLVVPTVLDEGAGDRPGPLASALGALAAAAAAGSRAEQLALGASLLATAFAGCRLVVDARHALLRPRRNGRRPLRLAIGRTLICERTGASPSECHALVERIDGWLAARGSGRIDDAPTLALVGPRASEPWSPGAAEPIGVDGLLWPTVPRARDVRPT